MFENHKFYIDMEKAKAQEFTINFNYKLSTKVLYGSNVHLSKMYIHVSVARDTSRVG